MEFALDTTVLSMIPEKKGTLLLRSNHMKYGRATLNSNWWVSCTQNTLYDFRESTAIVLVTILTRDSMIEQTFQARRSWGWAQKLWCHKERHWGERPPQSYVQQDWQHHWWGTFETSIQYHTHACIETYSGWCSSTQTMKNIQTTQQEAMCQVHELKEDYQLRDTHKAMVAYDNFDLATANRDTGKPERGYGSVLPRHQLQHDKRHLNTTHKVDYQYPFEWTPKPEEVGYSILLMCML